MTVDFSRFVSNETIILPIVQQIGVYKGRKLFFPKDTMDGWYRVTLSEPYRIEKRATPLEIKKETRGKNTYRVYPIGEEAIPMNFTNFSLQGRSGTILVHFMQAIGIFHIAYCVRLEDGNFYFTDTEKRINPLLSELRTRFEKNQGIGEVKGVTPELRYYFLLLCLQRQSYQAFKELDRMNISKEEREKRIKEFQGTFVGRLKEILAQAGGTFIRVYKSGKDWLIEWKVNNHMLKSIIKDNMSIISLGFCASNFDREHSMASAIQLAKLYSEKGTLNITRR